MAQTQTPEGAAGILAVEGLQVYFGRRSSGLVRAVDGVDLTVRPGETVGLIGESGSGKTTVGMAMLGLVRPTSGRVLVGGEPAWQGSRQTRREHRRKIQAIFQDPSEALDPRMSVADSIAEPVRVAGVRPGPELTRRVDVMLERVGLDSSHGHRKPHELSGGQKQRVNIARALMLEPSVIVCDEAVSALDVSIQADILNLLKDLQRERGVAYLFISHDIGVIAHMADRISVMYLGRILESGTADDVLARPRHPYTKSLIASTPEALPQALRPPRPRPLQGDIPSPANLPSGCRFRTRCPLADEHCAAFEPALTLTGDNHFAACHYADSTSPSPVPVSALRP